MVLWLHRAGTGLAFLLYRTMIHSSSPNTRTLMITHIGNRMVLWNQVALMRRSVTPDCSPMAPGIGWPTPASGF